MLCKRAVTVSKLATLTSVTRLVHVRGSPRGGKTTLALLLATYFLRNNTPAALVASWPVGRKGDDVLIEAARGAGYPIGSRSELMATDIVFIIDDAETSYKDEEFWEQTVKSQTGAAQGPRFCVFTSAAHCPPGSPLESLLPEHRVPIFTCRLGAHRPAALYFSREEFSEALNKLSLRLGEKLLLTNCAKRYLWLLSFGHPGVLRSVVDTLRHVAAPFFFHPALAPWTLTRDKFYHDYLRRRLFDPVSSTRIAGLVANGLLFEHLRGTVLYGSFVSQRKLTLDAHAVLQRAFNSRQTPFDRNQPGISQCFQEGWLHALSAETGEPGTEFVMVFPSGLHAKYEGCLGLNDSIDVSSRANND